MENGRKQTMKTGKRRQRQRRRKRRQREAGMMTTRMMRMLVMSEGEASHPNKY